MNIVFEGIDIQKDSMKLKFGEIREDRENILKLLKMKFDTVFNLKLIFSAFKQYAKKEITFINF